ncbi:MAG: tail-specific protease [Gammaproteobacteria bacterium]|nr:tail-specific protease [Gammaproteobacteria bacterium]
MKTQLRRNLKALAFGIAAGVAFTAWAQSEPEEKSLETANPVLEVVTAPKLAPLDVHPNTSLTVVEQLRHTHYVRKTLDDGISSNIFDNYLDNLDGGRAYFLATDIEQFEKYRYTLDDSLKRGKLDAAFEIFNLFQQRAVNRLQYLLSEINNGLSNIDFSVEEEIEIDRESAPWPVSEAARDNIWRKRLKAAVLSMKLNDKDLEEISTLLTKRYKNRLKQTLQTKSEDAFQLYMNAFASTYDPHTQYFSPRTSQNFNITMSLSLEGIGAVLKAQDDYTEVVRLVPAGPADKSGGIKVADKIISVGQGQDGPLIDIVGWRLDDVVEMIRGPKGSQVRLEVVPSDSGDGVSKIVSITRNTVQLEEQAAQAKLLTLNQAGREYRIGIIDVPTFYIDFRASQQGDPNFRSTTRDVGKLIDQLKAQDIDGLIIDLRNNGGGSLQEADTLTGLFIETGPTVQVKSARRRANIYADTDASTAWDGPMAVMVNRLSASASEIFAGAIQDYGRGLILGSQTFGKGTVQTLIPLSRGQLKITAAKFYRVSGQSTQHQGVLPDIEFPELFDTKLIGESSLDDALPWDMIKPAVYSQAHEIESLLDELRRRHTSRVASNVEFNYLNALIEKSRQMSQRTHLSLNENARRDQKAQDDEWRLSLENTLRNAKGKPLAKTLDELEELEKLEKAEEKTPVDQDIAENSDAEETALTDVEVATTVIETQKDDAMREEAGRVLLDLIELSMQIAGLENVPTTQIGTTAQIPATPASSTDGS